MAPETKEPEASTNDEIVTGIRLLIRLQVLIFEMNTRRLVGLDSTLGEVAEAAETASEALAWAQSKSAEPMAALAQRAAFAAAFWPFPESSESC